MASIEVGRRELICMQQSILDEIDILTKNRFLDDDQKRERIIVCNKVLGKIRIGLSEEYFKEHNQNRT